MRVLGEVLKTVMGREGGGFEMRDVFFFGFGQGGVVALSLAEALGGKELGGVVAVGGRLPGSRTAMKSALEVAGIKDTELASGKKARTSVILCGGNRGTVVTSDAVADLKARFETVTYTKWAREGDGMMRNREEMLPIMKFLASRLRMPAPEGMEEVGGFQA